MERNDKKVYPKDIRESPEFNTLYARWRVLLEQNVSQVFMDFEKFFRWSMKNGYAYGSKLILIDPNKPYSPVNCEWDYSKERSSLRPVEREEFIKAWNTAVNRIRKHYGMDQLPGTEDATNDGQSEDDRAI